MPAVILILGLIAAGVYTNNGWFYVVAFFGGGSFMILTLLIAGIMKAAASEITKNASGFTNNSTLRKRLK